MAGFDMNSISVIEPGHKRYDQLDVVETLPRKHQSSRFYNQVVQVYNESPVGALVIVPLEDGMKLYNLKNVLAGRGLKPGVDIIVTRQETSDKGEPLPRSLRPAKLKKLSDTEGKLVDSIPGLADDVVDPQ